jgi:hypothetical protein
MVSKSFTLTIDGKSYQVEVVRPGVIAVDGNIFNVEKTPNGVTVDGEPMVGSMSEGFAVVGGKLYETEWQVK